MNLEALYWLSIAAILLFPIFFVFFLVRARLGVSEHAWNLSAQFRTSTRHAGDGGSGPDNGYTTDDRDLPGHCSSCGKSVDDSQYDRCWNCAQPVD